LPAAYDELRGLLREAATLRSLGTLAAWDQETMMPPRAGAFRAEELALVSRLAHERFTHPRVGELLAACESDAGLLADSAESANLRGIRRDYERATRLPPGLVSEISRTSSLALEVWRQARGMSDFPSFRPWLDRLVALNRDKASCLGVPEGGELYDALLEDFEPGMTAARLEAVFAPLRRELAPLIAKAATSREPESVSVPVELQREFNLHVAKQVGFEFEAGRLDVSTHPFTEGLGPGDTRITTRYREDGFTDALSSTLHEVGHALYEQGLPKQERLGQPLGEPASLGLHESQSRLWENQVGRSRAFWTWALGEARRVCGEAVRSLTVEQIHRDVNVVRPGLIRIEADETTYNLHVMFRFDIERRMLRGDLPVAEVPSAWNARMAADLGLAVPDDRRGCLQDIHWAAGAIGYFPTYTLGNLYAAQLWETLTAEIGDLEAQLERGEFSGLVAWLRRNIHAHGRRHTAEELCRSLTGRPLDPQALISYLSRKHA
jgi:carboxypeptidase Taq